jgi:hypothetical protein
MGIELLPLRATPLLSMWPCTLKFDEEKPNYAHLAQENSFFPAYFYHFSNKLSNNYFKFEVLTLAPGFLILNFLEGNDYRE